MTETRIRGIALRHWTGQSAAFLWDQMAVWVMLSGEYEEPMQGARGRQSDQTNGIGGSRSGLEGDRSIAPVASRPH